MEEIGGGPRFKHLRKLRGMLPSLVKGMNRNKIGGKGVPVLPRARQICEICARMFDHAIIKFGEDTALKSGICEVCKPSLDEGYIAFVTHKQYAFVKSKAPECADLHGKIVKISDEHMNKLADAFEWQRVEQRMQYDRDAEADQNGEA